MVEIPDSLVERLKERQVVLIAGLGCSELADAPGWNELMERSPPGWCSPTRARSSPVWPTSGRMTDAIAFIRDQLPHQLVEEELAKAYPDGMAVPDASGGLRPLPVARGRDHARSMISGSARSIRRTRHPPPAVGPDRGRSDQAQRRQSRRCRPCFTFRAGLPCPRASDWDRATRASGWRCRRASPGWTTWPAAVARVRRLSPHRSGPGLAVVVAGGAPAQGVPTSCSWTCRRKPDADTEVSVWALKTGFEVIPCLEGTAEACGAAGDDRDVDRGAAAAARHRHRLRHLAG